MAEPVGCYTTARVTRGRVERLERHAGRLRRDAERLGLALPSRREIETAFLSAARATFPDRDGIVRLEWSSLAGEAPELRATSRELGADPPQWRARVSATIHPGPEARHNTKFVVVDAYERAREEAREQSVDEVLLFDADGRLVEGGHSNFLLVDAAGRLHTPDRRWGAVEGLGLSLVLESRPETRSAELKLADVRAARELMAVNCVRGVVPIVELDGEPFAGGRAGPWAARLRRLFFRD